MKNLALLLASALLAAAALAGVTSTEAPTVFMILLADNTIETGKKWPATIEECRARAKALFPKGSCSVRYTFDNVGDCTDAVKPKWPLEKDADGSIIKPRFKDDGFKPGSDTEYKFLVEDFVPAPFPDCWVKGWRTAELEEINAPDPDDAQLANSIEPMPTTPEYEATWHLAVNEAKRHEQFECNEDDQTPCPARQVVRDACGSYDKCEPRG